MKPINLKIKGLNSFIEQQEINFETLTDRGLFGIFGPTGSGKSTILDGITLALYGEVARKSTNYMNTNCDSLNVSYEFQISEKEIKRYRVDREFRRDKKTESIRSKSAKIIEIVGDSEIILEDSVKNVTKKCEEIIGLKSEDFTRTVVLPQGNFSEFLKLEGKERRDMLERLFNLQKYGDHLSIKLGMKIKEEREHANFIEGELKGYEDCSEEILAEKKRELAEIAENHLVATSACEIAQENYTKGKELWELQKEFHSEMEADHNLRSRELEIKSNHRKVELGERALKVKPYIDNYEDTQNKINNLSIAYEELSKSLATIKSSKEQQQELYNIAKNKKDKELSLLQIREQQVIEAIEEGKSLRLVSRESSKLAELTRSIAAEVEEKSTKVNQEEMSIATINKEIGASEVSVEQLKIPEEYKKKLTEAIVAFNRFESIKQQKYNLDQELTELAIFIEQRKIERQEKLMELQAKGNQLIQYEKNFKHLMELCPGDQNQLVEKQEQLSSKREKWEKQNHYRTAMQKSSQNIQELELILAEKIPQTVTLKQEIEAAAEVTRKMEQQNMAAALRTELTELDICPVCGSTKHQLENLQPCHTSELEKLHVMMRENKQVLEELSNKVVAVQANITMEQSYVKEYSEKIKELGYVSDEKEIKQLQTEFDNLKKSIEEFYKSKTELEQNTKQLQEEKSNLDIEYSKINTTITGKEEQILKEQNKSVLLAEGLSKVEAEVATFKTVLGVEDFEEKSNEVLQKDKRREVLEQKIRNQRAVLSNAQTSREEYSKELSILKEELTKKQTTLAETKQRIKEITAMINKKAGPIEELEKRKAELSNTIKNIITEYEVAERNKELIEGKYKEINEKIISLQSNWRSLSERLESDKTALANALLEEQMTDVEGVKAKVLSKAQMEKMKSEIEAYGKAVARTQGAIENLKFKINNRSLTEEQWIAVQANHNEKAVALKEIAEQEIRQIQNVYLLNEKLIAKKELLKKKKRSDDQLDLLGDLEKLFKGKKFVEFVATNQLKYVSMEACKKLKEITGGNYGLEVDENGKFLIRDYKNGGAKRDASTLSGGETFLASLSLALALSAQIQLKGTAPLELFFLDEGFGTLDDNLLETVMDSLEKIHNDKLSVGIISHLEVIKERMPVKLMVTPAKSGLGGSRVKIERN